MNPAASQYQTSEQLADHLLAVDRCHEVAVEFGAQPQLRHIEEEVHHRGEQVRRFVSVRGRLRPEGVRPADDLTHPQAAASDQQPAVGEAMPEPLYDEPYFRRLQSICQRYEAFVSQNKEMSWQIWPHSSSEVDAA